MPQQPLVSPEEFLEQQPLVSPEGFLARRTAAPPDDRLVPLPQAKPAVQPPRVSGMEQLGGVAPGPPPVKMMQRTVFSGPTPGAPGSPEGIPLHPEMDTTSPEFQKNLEWASDLHDRGNSDLLGTTARGGVEVAKGVAKVGRALGPPRLPNQSAATADADAPRTPLDVPLAAEGAHEAASGAFDVAGQFIPAGFAANATRTALGLAGGLVAQKATDYAAEKAGVRPEYRAVLGDAAAIIGGHAAGTRGGDAVEAVRATRSGPRTFTYRDEAGAPKGSIQVYGDDDSPAVKIARNATAPPEPSVSPEELLGRESADKAGPSADPAPPVSPEEFLGSDGEPPVAEQKPEAAPPPEQATAAPQGGGGEFLGSGLGALQPYYDSAVAAMSRNVAETKAALSKRAELRKALKAIQSTPAQQAIGQRIMQYFTGERDLWGARMNQVLESVRKMVPDVTEQEGLSLMRDFKSRPGELQQWYNGTHPSIAAMKPDAQATWARNSQRIRAAVETALNPTPGMMAADNILTQIADVSLDEGRRVGFLDSSIPNEEYVTHILHPPDMSPFSQLSENEGRSIGGKMKRRFANAQKREYPTLLDAIADNVKPRTLNAIDAFTIHADRFATSRATRMLVDELKSTGLGKWQTGKNAKTPADWVTLAPHANEFRQTVSFLDQAGEPASAQQSLKVPRFIQEALAPITDPDYSNKIAGFTVLRRNQAYLKAVQLGMSLFHATTENYMAVWNMGPRGWAKGLVADRGTPEFREAERRFVQHGGTSPIQGKTAEAYYSLEPGSIPTLSDAAAKLPIISQLRQIGDKLTKLTFDNLQRKFKVTDFALHEAQWRAKNPNASPAETTVALQSIAKEINAVYGGLHKENLGINRTTMNAARAFMLAPDWTFSNVVNARYAFERGTPAGQMARAFWARQAVGALALTQLTSLLLTRQPSKRPFQVYLGQDKDGRGIYQNIFFKGAGGDLVNLINNVKEYGLSQGAGKSLVGKAAPILRAGIQIATNRDFMGREIVPKGTDFLPATARGAWATVKSLAPIPLTGTNLFDMATTRDERGYTLPEFLTVPFAGTPPQHLPPDGFRMTKQGLKPKGPPPVRSFMDQFRGTPGPKPPRIR